MTMDIKMLKDISDSANVMAERMMTVAEAAKEMAAGLKAVVDDCAEQIAQRKASGVSESEAMNEAFDHIKPSAAETTPLLRNVRRSKPSSEGMAQIS